MLVVDFPVDGALLRARYPAGHPVIAVDGAGEREIRLEEVERSASHYLVLAPVDPYLDLASLAAVTRIAERLRAPDGCPWDREQTHASLRPHLLEEAYEALEALDAGDMGRLQDELGDLLFQIAIHAQLANEEGAFDIGDVARRIGEKLVRRHPHVFAGTTVRNEDLLLQWERIKREEHAGGAEFARSVLDGLPKDLPALFAAERLQERAARVRLVPPRVELPLDVDDPEFLGELLFDLVAAAREQGFDAESALREANARFAARVSRVEARARADGRPLESYAPAEMRALWEGTAS